MDVLAWAVSGFLALKELDKELEVMESPYLDVSILDAKLVKTFREW
jgi:hypothetical protein